MKKIKHTLAIALAVLMMTSVLPVYADEVDISTESEIVCEQEDVTEAETEAEQESEATLETIETEIGIELESETTIEMVEQTEAADEELDEAELLEASDQQANEGFYYNVKVDGTIEIMGCADDTIAELKIPETLEGKNVTSIGDGAFKDNQNITNVSFPSTVTEIGRYAFSGCTNLKDIGLVDNVRVVRRNAFDSCRSLTYVGLYDTITDIGSYAFANCTSLKEAWFATSATDIGSHVFDGCTKIESITMPNLGAGSTLYSLFGESVKNVPASLTYIHLNNTDRIPAHAFEGCKYLKTIDYDSSVQTIGSYAFAGCIGLKKMEIKNNVSFLGKSVFSGCKFLNSITFLGDAPKFDSTAFAGLQTHVYYPATKASWTVSKLKNYGGNITYEATGALIKPVITTVKNSRYGVTVGWTGMQEAIAYKLYRKASDEKEFTLIYRSKTYDEYKCTPWYVDSSAKSGKTYCYRVRAIGSDMQYIYSDVTAMHTYVAMPQFTQAANTSAGVKLSWNKVNGVDGYEIYTVSNDDTYKKIATINGNSTVSYVDKNVVNGRMYRYSIKAFKYSNGKYIDSIFCDKPILIVRLTKPTITNIQIARRSINVCWKEKSGATEYEIWVSTVSDFSTKRIWLAGEGMSSKKITDLNGATKYYVKMRAIYDDHYRHKSNGAWSSTKIVTTNE